MNVKLKLSYMLTIYLAFIIVSCEHRESTTYYISNKGNDKNQGTSKETPWKTLKNINTRVKLLPGDSILFQAGGIWRQSLKINQSGTPDNYIYIGRYGEGNNPALYGSEKAKKWKKTKYNSIWISSTSLLNLSTKKYPGRIFFVENDSTSWGKFKNFKPDFTNLAEEFDYTISEDKYYIYSPSDPNIKYQSIEVTQRRECIKSSNLKGISFVHINGVDLYFASEYGYNPGYPATPGVTNLIFQNCNIGYIGAKGSGKAYGMELISSNSLVENCNFNDCGRRAISINLYDVGGNIYSRTVENVIIRNNTFKRGWHTTSLDIAVNKKGNGDTIRNVYFYNNYIDDSELKIIDSGQSSNQTFIYQTGASYVNNIYLVNNIYVGATGYNVLTENCDTIHILSNTVVGHNQNIHESPYGNVGSNGTNYWDFHNNIVYCNLPNKNLHNYMIGIYNKYTNYISRNYNLYFILNPSDYEPDRRITIYFDGKKNHSFRMNDWISYKQITGFDKNSPTPQNPKFIDYNQKNFHLSDYSIAIGNGIPIRKIITDPLGINDTIGKYDFDGVLRNKTNPSLGAYEFFTVR